MYIFEVIKKQASGAKLTLADKVKLVMLNSAEVSNLEDIVEAHDGQPSFLGFANTITDRVLMGFSDVLKDKMRKDGLKKKPRFRTEADAIAQIKAEVAALFSSEKQPDLCAINTNGYDLNRVLYCYAPEGLSYYFDNHLEYFVDGLDPSDFKEVEVYKPTPTSALSALNDNIMDESDIILNGKVYSYQREASSSELLA